MRITLERALEEMKLSNNSVRGKAASQQKQWQSINGKLPIRVHESTCIMHDTRVTIVLTRESSMRESAGRARESLIRTMWTIGAISKSTQRGTAQTFLSLRKTSPTGFDSLIFRNTPERFSLSLSIKKFYNKKVSCVKNNYIFSFPFLWNRFLSNF